MPSHTHHLRTMIRNQMPPESKSRTETRTINQEEITMNITPPHRPPPGPRSRVSSPRASKTTSLPSPGRIS